MQNVQGTLSNYSLALDVHHSVNVFPMDHDAMVAAQIKIQNIHIWLVILNNYQK